MSENINAGLIAHWKFDEGTGRVVHDSSGNENHGAIIPDEAAFETWGTDEFDGTLSFTRKDQNHLRIPPSDSLNQISKKLTVVANFYPRSFPTREELEQNMYANYVSAVQRMWANATHPDLFYLGFGPGDEVHGPTGILEYKWHLGIKTPEGVNEMADLYVPDETGTIVPNQWMHMVGTYDGDSGMMCLFLNGEKIGEHNLPGSLRAEESMDSPLVIACELNANQEVVGNLDGFVDEVRIYDRVLTEAEVLHLAKISKK